MRPGEVFADRFTIERVAGTGGMGTVFRARDERGGADVALKVLHVDDPRTAERFTREAEVLAELEHPGIVRYVDHGVADGRTYLALEWIEGPTLSDRIGRTGLLTIQESVDVTARVADALGFLHRRGIVHRDVKPSNVMLVGGALDNICLLDFGLTRLARQAVQLTQTGAMLGTPGYMAPEQARGLKDIDSRADVFSLGCLLFKCLTGRGAFDGEDGLTVLLKVVLEEAPRPGDLRDGVPPALDDLIAAMISKSPEERPRDGDAAAAALRALDLSGAPTSLRMKRGLGLTREERRILCLVVARPPGRDAADVTVDARSQQVQSALIEDATTRHQAKLERLADGSLAALLTSSSTATDLAARAARCALTIRATLPATVPIAIVTGRGVVSETVPLGGLIQRAVSMLRARRRQAPRDDVAPISVDEVTAGLLGARFHVEGDSSGLYLLAERDVAETARTLIGRPTPYVGRTRELSQVTALFEECVNEPVARVALVTGPAGIGKSRLRYEFLRKVREDFGSRPLEIWVGRGDAVGAGSPLGMLAFALRRAFGLREGESLAVRRSKTRARLSRHLRDDRLERVCEFLGELLGAPASDDHDLRLKAARQDPRLMGDQLLRAWEEFIDAECSAQPVLLVLEDLHWGDPATIRFVDAAVTRCETKPLMVLALARPDVHELFPRLWAERGVLETRLLPLTRKASERLVRDVLGASVDTDAIERITERAGGNAFYLEELIRAFSEGHGAGFPETVLAMVQARLDGLEPRARRVLRAASVFGDAFWVAGVAALLGNDSSRVDLEERLIALVDQELITRRPECRFPGDHEYVFRHALVREAAYAMLTDADRTLGHRLAGAWLETVGESDPLVLAEHFEWGGEAAHAGRWFKRAAQQALELNDLEGAIARSVRSEACGAMGEELGELQLIEAEAHTFRGDTARAEECATAALRLLPKASPPWYRAAGAIVMVAGQAAHLGPVVETLAALREHGTAEALAAAEQQAMACGLVVWLVTILGQYAAAAPFAECLRELEPRLGATSVAAGWIHLGLAFWHRFAEGDPWAEMRRGRAAVDAFERIGDERSVAFGRVIFASALIELGAFDEAAAELRVAWSEAHDHGALVVAAYARWYLGLAVALGGQLEEGHALLCTANEEMLATGHVVNHANVRKTRARILAMSESRLDEAEAEARASIEVLGVSTPNLIHALGVLASILSKKGETEEALATAERAASLLDGLGAMGDGEAFIRLVFIEAMFAAGKTEAARDALASAHARLLARAAKIEDAGWRARFLTEVRENARTIELARARAS